jgi:hypothetical protein
MNPIDASAWFQNFAITEKSSDEIDALLERSNKLALQIRDKSDLPARTLDRKIEDCMVGIGLEIHAEAIPNLTRASLKYRDFDGQDFNQEWLNGRTEWKTVNRPTLEASLRAIDYAGNKDYDHVIVWYCNRQTMTYSPLYVFKKGKSEPIHQFQPKLT